MPIYEQHSLKVHSGIEKLQIVRSAKGDPQRSALRLFPTLETVFVSNVDGAFSKDGEFLFAGLLGIHETSFRLDHRGNADRWSIHFQPGALSRFTSTPAYCMTNQVTNIGEFFGLQMVDLCHRMAEDLLKKQFQLSAPMTHSVSDHAIWKERISNLLRRLFRTPSKQENFVVILSRWMRQRKKMPDKQEIDSLSGLSMRQIERLFRQEIGCSMRTFLRLARFEEAIKLIHLKSPFADAAVASGYYDQSHMIREFRRISGFTPLQYASAEYPCDLLEQTPQTKKNLSVSLPSNTEAL